MAVNYTAPSFTGGTPTGLQLTAAFQGIEVAFADALSQTVSGGNALDTDLDLNGNDLLNVGGPGARLVTTLDLDPLSASVASLEAGSATQDANILALQGQVNGLGNTATLQAEITANTNAIAAQAALVTLNTTQVGALVTQDLAILGEQVAQATRLTILESAPAGDVGDDSPTAAVDTDFGTPPRLESGTPTFDQESIALSQGDYINILFSDRANPGFFNGNLRELRLNAANGDTYDYELRGPTSSPLTDAEFQPGDSLRLYIAVAATPTSVGVLTAQIQSSLLNAISAQTAVNITQSSAITAVQTEQATQAGQIGAIQGNVSTLQIVQGEIDTAVRTETLRFSFGDTIADGDTIARVLPLIDGFIQTGANNSVFRFTQGPTGGSAVIEVYRNNALFGTYTTADTSGAASTTSFVAVGSTAILATDLFEFRVLSLNGATGGTLAQRFLNS